MACHAVLCCGYVLLVCGQIYYSAANWQKRSTEQRNETQLWGSGGQKSRSRSHDAGVSFGGLSEVSFSTSSVE